MDNHIYQTASTATQTNNTNISFYCMICFDTFNTKTRPPVILPCGHTFICSQCSKRIKSCMECRTSLFLRQEKPKVLQQGGRQRANSGYSPRTYRRHVRGSPEVNVKKPPAQDPPIPLPLPKNELMLSLLESANCVIHHKKEHKGKEDEDDVVEDDLVEDIVCVEIKEEEGPEDEIEDDGKMIVEVQEDGEEDEVVDTSILSTPPRSTSKDEAEVTPAAVPIVTSSSWSSDEEEEDHDAEKVLIALETSLGSGGTYVVIDPDGLDILPYKPKGYIDKRNELESEYNGNLKLPANLAKLNYGDRIQVVDIQDTVVKLARSKGYLIATSTQLVKITIPFDDACLIESHLISLHPKYRRLNRMVDKLNAIEEHLLQDLNTSIQQDDYPAFIIEPAPPEEDIRSTPTTKHVEFNIHRNPPPPPPPTPSYNHPEVIKPTIDDEEFVTAAAGCTSFFGIGSHADIDTDSSTEDNAHYYTGIFCPSSNAFRINDPPDDREQERLSPPITARTSTSISPTRTPLQLDAVVSPFVDFRTGRSGHLALTSTKASYPKKYQNPREINIRMMSDHKGIGNIKPIHRNINGAPDSPYSTSRGHRSLSTKTW